MQKRAKPAWPTRLLAVVVVALLFAGSGSDDAVIGCEGHVPSGAADVRVDAAVDIGPMPYPVTSLYFNGRGIGEAIDPDNE